jgi:hypothetical protein
MFNIKTSSRQLNAAIIIPEDGLDKVSFTFDILWFVFYAMWPGLEILIHLHYPEHRTLLTSVFWPAFMVHGFLSLLTSFAKNYTKVSPDPSDFYRVFEPGKVVFPTGLWGRMMLFKNYLGLTLSTGVLIWVAACILASTTSWVTLAVSFVAVIIGGVSLVELGWYGKVPPTYDDLN